MTDKNKRKIHIVTADNQLLRFINNTIKRSVYKLSRTSSMNNMLASFENTRSPDIIFADSSAVDIPLFFRSIKKRNINSNVIIVVEEVDKNIFDMIYRTAAVGHISKSFSRFELENKIKQIEHVRIIEAEKITLTDQSNEKINALTNKERKLQLMLGTDHLTQLRNFNFLKSFMKGHSDKKKRFLYFDIDNFTRINSEIGNDSSNAILRRVGNIIKGRVDKESIVVRYEADRFIVFFPYLTAELEHRAMTQAKAIQSYVNRTISRLIKVDFSLFFVLCIIQKKQI